MAASISLSVLPTAMIIHTIHFSAPETGDIWSTVQGGGTYTAPLTGAQISIGLRASGYSNDYGELDFASIITVNDPALGTIEGGLGNGYFPSDGTDVSGGYYNVGQKSRWIWNRR